MNDQNKAELRRLAEAQPIKEWTREEGELPVMNSSVLMFGVRGPECVSDFEGWGFTRAAASYIAAADPAAVLSLLDELEEAQNGMKYGCAMRLKSAIDELSTERDQLRAEVEALRKDAQRNSWVSVEDRLPDHDGPFMCWFGLEKPSCIQQRTCIFIHRHGVFCDGSVTHWMPMKSAPSAEGSANG